MQHCDHFDKTFSVFVVNVQFSQSSRKKILKMSFIRPSWDEKGKFCEDGSPEVKNVGTH